MNDKDRALVSFFCMWISCSPSTVYCRNYFSPLSVLGYLIKYYLTIYAFGGGGSSLFHWFMSVFMPISCCIDYYSFLTFWNQKLQWCQLCFSFSRLLWLFRVVCDSKLILELFFNFCKKWQWNLDRDFSGSADSFG